MGRKTEKLLQGLTLPIPAEKSEPKEVINKPTPTDIVEPKVPINSIQSKKVEVEYVEIKSELLENLRERLEIYDDQKALFECINEHGDLSSYWVGQRLRCLTECVLLFSEAKFTRVSDLMEICNAFTLMIQSKYFGTLPDSFPYVEYVFELRYKLKKLCIKVHKVDVVKFRLQPQDKYQLLVTRYELSQYVPKSKFNQLKFD